MLVDVHVAKCRVRLLGLRCLLLQMVPVCGKRTIATPFADSSFSPHSRRAQVNTTVVASSGKKIDIKKQGLNSIEDKTIQLNLMGKSESMEKKGWTDASGREGMQGVAGHVVGCALGRGLFRGPVSISPSVVSPPHRPRHWRVQVCQQIRMYNCA